MTDYLATGALPDHYQQLAKTVRDFAQSVVAPVAAKHDEEHGIVGRNVLGGEMVIGADGKSIEMAVSRQVRAVGAPAGLPKSLKCASFAITNVLLVRGAYPGIVRDEHIAFVDTGIVAAVLKCPFHLCIRDAGHVLHERTHVHELGVLGQDRGIEVQRVHRHRRAFG